MPKFIYIQAIVQKNELDRQGPGAIRFRHTVVDAADDNGAYSEGGKWSDEFPPHNNGYHPDVEVINDYAIFVPDSFDKP